MYNKEAERMNDIKRLDVPKWGLSIEDGTVTKWLIEVGDGFEEGQEIVELETSKITNVLEAPFASVLRRIVAEPGVTLPVGGLIGLCAQPSVRDEQVEAFLAGLDAFPDMPPGSALMALDKQTALNASSNSEPKPSDRAGVNVPTGFGGWRADADVLATAHARSYAERFDIDLAKVIGTGRRGRVSVDDVRTAIASAGGVAPAFGKSRVDVSHPLLPNASLRATPSARKLADEAGVSLAAIAASSGERIVRGDVERAVAVRSVSREAPEKGREPSRIVPLTNIRRTIAKRLQQSKQTAPHYRVAMNVEIDGLLSLRKAINAGGARVTVNDFLIKASSLALVGVPEVNVQFDGEVVAGFEHADIAVAVSTDAGFIAPILRSVDLMVLVDISRAVRDLSTRARAGRLRADEIEGGTFSISNLGMFGVSHFDAIINPPQVAILAVGSAEERVLPGTNGPRTTSVLTLTLSSDHRVIDGATAAEFLSELRAYLETPGLMLS